MQKDHTEYYRGVEFDTQLLPKIKVEIVVCKIPVDSIIDTVKKILDSGTIGDGRSLYMMLKMLLKSVLKKEATQHHKIIINHNNFI
jgi:nitrogen regulatory protein PII